MNESADPPPANGQLMHEAGIWFARMRGPEAETIQAEFKAWLARGALHRAAYNRVAEVFAMGKLLVEDEERAQSQEAQPSRRRPERSSLLVLLTGMIGVALLAALIFAARPTAPGGPAPQVAQAEHRERLTTAPGETRRVQLADGSTIRLGPGTRLDLRFDDTLRRLDLRSGRVRFEVARDPRPFTVHAGGGSVTARGTIFEIALSAARQVKVHLIEGAIDVRVPAARAALEIRRLRPGETMTFAADAALRPDMGAAPPPIDPVPVTELDAVALGELIARANRTGGRSIRLADPALAERRVSGRLALDDNDRLAERIAALLDLTVGRGPDDEIVIYP